MADMLLESFTRLLASACPPATVRAAESGADCAALWAELEASGFLDALLPEDAGGAGLALAEVFALVTACGECLLPVPFAETVIARALLQARGAALPAGAAVVLAAPGVLLPQSGCATHALLQRETELLLLPLGAAREGLFQLPGRAPDPDAEPLLSVPAGSADLAVCAAAITAALMAGAMQRVLAMTLDHVGQREQFGRKLGQFQAIQHQVAVLAEQVVSVQVAARTGFEGAWFETARTAIAKTRASEAAHTVCAIAHAAHGAIGVTAEYDLQLYTRRLKQWQLAFGGEACWARRLGALRAARPAGTAADFLRALLDEPAAASP